MTYANAPSDTHVNANALGHTAAPASTPATPPADGSADHPFDLVLTGGHLIDPLQGLDGLHDLAVHHGRVAAVLPGGSHVHATRRIDVTGQLVTPGMIDTHAHVFQHVTGRFGLEADLCGVRSGVTTLIDQGGPSCMTLPAFREFVVKPKQTRVYAYLSSYLVGGMEGHYYPALYKPDCLDVDATVKAALANTDIVKGFKAHAELGGFARWGIEVMRQSAEMARRAAMPLYIHFGQLWPLPAEGDNGVDPDTILAAVVPLLKAGDILAHPFTRHPGGFVNRQGEVHAIVREALAHGLKVDVGHGSHFSYRMARIALDAGIVPHTLGADMHGYNTAVPAPPGTPEAHSDQEHMFFGKQRFSLASAMTAMLALGLPLPQVVRMVTCNVVDVFGLPKHLGTLAVGNPADVTVLHDERGRWALRDNEGTQLIGERLLRPAFCLRDGERHDADASILPVVQAA
jgi:dihydroorotase